MSGSQRGSGICWYGGLESMQFVVRVCISSVFMDFSSEQRLLIRGGETAQRNTLELVMQ